MLFKKMKNNTLALLFCVVMPASAYAESDPFWTKLSAIAANGWMEIDSLSDKEMTRLTNMSEKGDANAQYALGMIHQVRHEHDKAAVWLKQAAEQGHAPARYSYNENATGHPEKAELSW